MERTINFYNGKDWTKLTLVSTSYGVTCKGIVGCFPAGPDNTLNVGIRRDDLKDYYIVNPFI